MQFLNDTKWDGHEFSSAVVLLKKEMDVLLSACGNKRGKIDARSLWIDFGSRWVSVTSETVAVRLYTPSIGAGGRVVIPEQSLPKVSKTSQALLVAESVNGTVLAVIESRDYLDGDDFATMNDSEIIMPIVDTSTFTITHDKIGALFDATAQDGTGESYAVPRFTFGAAALDVLAKIGKLTGGSETTCLMPPRNDLPLLIEAGHDHDAAPTTVQVLVQPLL